MICLLCRKGLRECRCEDGAVYDLPRARREANDGPLPDGMIRIEDGVAFDAPPLRAGMLRIETELRVDGEPVASVYFSVPARNWQDLSAEKRKAIVAGLQDAAIEKLLTVRTTVLEHVEDPEQPELFAEIA